MAKRARKRGKGGRFLKAGSTPRRRRRRAVARRATTAPRRRRRRAAVARVVRVNAPRRRRRRTIAVSSRRRRRSGFRRNPGGIIGRTLDDIKAGGAVVVGQVANRKIRGAVGGVLPANIQAQLATGVGHLAVCAGAAVATSFATKFLPGSFRRWAPFIAAGAWSEAINAGLAQTPAAPFLSAFPARRPTMRVGPGRRVAAWPLPVGAGTVSAYPTMRSVGVPMHAGM